MVWALSFPPFCMAPLIFFTEKRVGLFVLSSGAAAGATRPEPPGPMPLRAGSEGRTRTTLPPGRLSAARPSGFLQP